MKEIHRLDPLLANQIAAGEVIERPASVVKELVENSLDAGSSRIDIHIEKAGKQLIKITDNGHGIPKDQMSLAVERHATSKITILDDLESVASLGFRGEALASIASVSRLQLTSHAIDCEQAWQLRGEGRDTHFELTPTAHPQGTTVAVHDLFFNTPARRKFLRTEKTELERINDIVRRIALAHPQVAFNLFHNQKPLLRVSSIRAQEQLPQRIAKICGQGFMQQANHLDIEASGLRLWGWLGHPEAARSQADTQYFYVNQRSVRDKLINHAIRQAYAEFLLPGKFPAYVLYLELDPAQVDVNVHPTKHEVRFRESRLVHDFIVHALDNGLTAELEAEEVESPVVELAQAEEIIPVSNNATRTVNKTLFPERPRLQQVREQLQVYADMHVPKQDKQQAYAGSTESPLGRGLAYVAKRFVIAATEQELFVVDMQQARRELALTDWQASLAKAKQLKPQALLLPAAIQLTEDDVDKLMLQEKALKQYGISIQRLTPQNIILNTCPDYLQNSDFKSLLTGWLTAKEEKRLDLLASYASQQVPDMLSKLELDQVLRELETKQLTHLATALDAKALESLHQ